MAAVPSFCPACGNQIPPGHVFCFKCGARKYEPVAAAPALTQAPPFAMPTAPPPPSPPPARAAAASPNAGWRAPPAAVPPQETAQCSNCGATVDGAAVTCWKCGQEFEPGVVPANANWAGPAGAGLGRTIPRVRTRSSATRRSIIGGTLLIVGMALLLVSLFVGWYVITASGSGSSDGNSYAVGGTATYSPFSYVETLTCSGSSYCFSNTTSTGAWSQGGSGSIGTLYDAVAAFVIGGIILGLAAAGLALAGGGRRSGLVGVLAVIVILLAVLAPLVLLAAQPTVLNGSSGNQSSGSSPRDSFFGSCSGSGCGQALASGTTLSASWGPSLGWYLSLGAVVPLLAGLFLVRGQRRGTAESSIYDSTG